MADVSDRGILRRIYHVLRIRIRECRAAAGQELRDVCGLQHYEFRPLHLDGTPWLDTFTKLTLHLSKGFRICTQGGDF